MIEMRALATPIQRHNAQFRKGLDNSFQGRNTRVQKLEFLILKDSALAQVSCLSDIQTKHNSFYH